MSILKIERFGAVVARLIEESDGSYTVTTLNNEEDDECDSVSKEFEEYSTARAYLYEFMFNEARRGSDNPDEVRCMDCGCELGERGLNHKYCERCLAAWYVENDVPDDVPNGDFDDDDKEQC